MTDTNDRLTRLLASQERAREERDMLVSQRNDIVRRADEAGRADLNAAEDGEFWALTARIAKIDAQVEKRDEQIRILAEFEALSVPKDDIDPETQKRTAAAEIFSTWRKTDKALPQTEEKPVRKLSLAQAQAITALDS
jgi:hypothetical protein